MHTSSRPWILVAAVGGVLAGYVAHEMAPDARTSAEISGYFSILADIFLRLIKMIIAPLVFATVVAGIAGTGDAKAVGRIGLKALAWFITASLVSLLLGMMFANLFQPGANLKATGFADEHATPALARAHRAAP
jgi:Na+/H+-dicarboxylate symporter